MKARVKLTTFFLLTTFLFFSCGENRSKKSNNVLIDESYIRKLVERQIGESNYYISIPIDYKIKATDGPDFSVYYFYSTDTTINANFIGGFYFGNFPNKFPPNNDSCKLENIKSIILNENSDWVIYNCNDKYSIQTIIENKSGEGWDEFIHAFGNAKSKKDLKKLLSIFKTMKMKK